MSNKQQSRNAAGNMMKETLHTVKQHMTSIPQKNTDAAPDQQTEQKILDAARHVFRRAGFGGARMQEIADQADISKPALHYYFRSKEKLFQQVFETDFERYMAPLGIIIRDPGMDLEKRIRTFVSSYIETLAEHPILPLFIMHELANNPDRISEFVVNRLLSGNSDQEHPERQGFGIFVNQISEGVQSGSFHPVDPVQYILSLLGMCVYPFIARPMIKKLLQLPEDRYRQMMLDRRQEVITYALRILVRDQNRLSHPAK